MTTALVASRSVVRKALAAMLQTALVGTGLPCEAVYDHQVADFEKQSPVVVVTSGAAQTPDVSERWIQLLIHLFVVYSATDTDGIVVWSEAQSEDALDLVEQMITSELLINADRTDEEDPEWVELESADWSQVNPIINGGLEYRHEVIFVRIKAANVQ